MPDAFEPLVQPGTFDAAQEALAQRFWRQSNEQLLDQLKSILKTHGHLSTAILRLHLLSPGSLSHRFGFLIKAYDFIGYQTSYRKAAEHRLHVRRIRTELMEQIVDMFPGKVSVFSWQLKRRSCLKLKNGTKVAVRICRAIHLVTKGRMWVLQAARDEPCQLTLVVGLNPENTAVEAFYLTTRLSNPSKIHITEKDEWLRKGVPLDDLRLFYGAATKRETRSV